MSLIDERKILTRERRLSTLSHFDGTLEQLKNEVSGDEIPQKIRTFTQIADDEIIFAIQILSRIKQAAVIVHGAVGCAASGIYFNQDFPVKWYSTNLNERDTILGSDEKLRNAVYRVYKEQCPEAIFIVGTPVVAINNDDVNSIIWELEDELGIKIIFIYSDGFKTKTPVTGYDIALHGLLKYIVGRNEPKNDFINVVTISESAANLSAVIKIFSDLHIGYRLLPQFSDIDSIRNASAAAATVVLNEDEGALFAQELEESFGVPYVKASPPIGIKETRAFIQALAQVLHIEEQASRYMENEEEKLKKQTEGFNLNGARVFFDGNLPAAAGFSELICELNGELAGISVPYADLQNRKYLDKLKTDIPVIVGTGQPFEKVNVLSKNHADYYISINYALTDTNAKPVSLAKEKYFGYEGAANIIRLIKEADRQSALSERLRSDNSYYRQAWLKRSSNWYVKQEVK